MNIIKQGNTQEWNKKLFKCNNCSCEFACNINEYYTDTSSSLSYPPKKIYVASCPCCHRICTAEQQTMEWTYTKTDGNDWFNATCNSNSAITKTYTNIATAEYVSAYSPSVSTSSAIIGANSKNDTRRNNKQR